MRDHAYSSVPLSQMIDVSSLPCRSALLGMPKACFQGWRARSKLWSRLIAGLVKSRLSGMDLLDVQQDPTAQVNMPTLARLRDCIIGHHMILYYIIYYIMRLSPLPKRPRKLSERFHAELEVGDPSEMGCSLPRMMQSLHTELSNYLCGSGIASKRAVL